MRQSKDEDATQGLTAKQQIERLIKSHFDEFDQRQAWFKSHAEAVAKLIATDFGARIGEQLDAMFVPKKILLSMPIEELVNAASRQITVKCKISSTDLIAKVNDNLRSFFYDTDKRIKFIVNGVIGHFEVILFPDLEGNAEEIMLFPELSSEAEAIVVRPQGGINEGK